jgi:hypothetical protein
VQTKKIRRVVKYSAVYIESKNTFRFGQSSGCRDGKPMDCKSAVVQSSSAHNFLLGSYSTYYSTLLHTSPFFFHLLGLATHPRFLSIVRLFTASNQIRNFHFALPHRLVTPLYPPDAVFNSGYYGGRSLVIIPNS